MKCPQCGAETPDEEWNCVACRINGHAACGLKIAASEER